MKATESTISVQLLHPENLSPSFVTEWAALEQRSCESNAYLSPYFVIPALRNLSTDEKPLFLAAWRDGNLDRQLVGMGVFVRRAATSRFPLPHLSTYLSPHTYLTGLLVDRDGAESIVRAYLRYFCSAEAWWHGVEFLQFRAEGALSHALAWARHALGLPWHEHQRWTRAILIPREGGDRCLHTAISAGRLKKLLSQKRKLAGLGALGWTLLAAEGTETRAVEAFLSLEDTGWRHEERTSLLSNPSHATFFREMIAAFGREGRAFFTELRVAEHTIASTCNLISGRAGFAFKIGWDTRYAKFSPGILNEVEMMQRAPKLFPNLDYIDSGAQQGSFIDSLWPNRSELRSGVLVTSRFGRGFLPVLLGFRGAKRYLGLRRRATPQNG